MKESQIGSSRKSMSAQRNKKRTRLKELRALDDFPSDPDEVRNKFSGRV